MGMAGRGDCTRLCVPQAGEIDDECLVEAVAELSWIMTFYWVADLLLQILGDEKRETHDSRASGLARHQAGGLSKRRRISLEVGQLQTFPARDSRGGGKRGGNDKRVTN